MLQKINFDIYNFSCLGYLVIFSFEDNFQNSFCILILYIEKFFTIFLKWKNN
jgi:hypothetical protein